LIVDVDSAARRLRAGEIVAYPTETVYGLGADATEAAALERLLALKGSEPGRAMSVLLGDADALEAWRSELPPAAGRLARRFWPGPLTLVLALDLPALAAVASGRGVGFRCSPWPAAAALARAAGPIVSTSANRSGVVPCTTAAEVERCFGPALAIAGGEPAGGLEPSTVVALDRDGVPELLREGPVAYPEVLREIAS
jgi:L-threonylcarbamoyladenylate synthase